MIACTAYCRNFNRAKTDQNKATPESQTHTTCCKNKFDTWAVIALILLPSPFLIKEF